MGKFLSFFLITCVFASGMCAGTCFSCCTPKKYIKLDPNIVRYLSKNVTDLQEDLHLPNIDSLSDPRGKTFFFGDYQFAGEARLKNALYIFYKKKKLPVNENLLRCFLFVLEKAIEQKVAPEISEALEKEYEKIEVILEINPRE